MSVPTDTGETCKGLIANGKHQEALALLRKSADPAADFPTQNGYLRTLKKINLANANLQPLRIALVPFYCSLDHFSETLRLWATLEGFELTIFLAEFDTAEQMLFDPTSDLYAFKPDVIWLFNSWRDVLPREKFPDCTNHAQARVVYARLKNLWEAISTHCSAYIFQNNADLPPDRVFGNHAPQISWSRTSILNQFNQILTENCGPGMTIFDLDYISSLFGKRQWSNEPYWYHSKFPFSHDAFGMVSFHAARLLCGLKGKSAKCLVLDLDNTLWGGVIGDDGMEGIRLGYGTDGEAHLDLQRYVLALKQRGIILAVCSKNEESLAKQPFAEHPDMLLNLDDIALFIANWNNKADNIRHIAKTLNISLSSLVFLDDNPAERALVSRELPMVTVPDLPEDPALYVRALDKGRYFELTAYTDEDSCRNDMYKGNACRAQLQASSTDTETFLKSLDMHSKASYLDNFSLPRIAQLINKGNQFHLTTTRYTETELLQKVEHGAICRCYTLTDSFGDNGLISGVILQPNGDTLEIDTWVMSCRVLCRGMEQFIHNDLIEIAKQRSVSALIGLYLPTPKNKMVADLYPCLGYSIVEETEIKRIFQLDIHQAKSLDNHISPRP